MQYHEWKSKLAGGALVAALLVAAGGTYAAEPPALPRRDSVPRLLRAIEFGDYGSPVVRFGDLNGDGQIEALVVQEDASGGQDQIIVTCLTAIDLEGKILWQVGKPNRRNVWTGSDTPIQIHDIDGDGQAEVVYQDPKSLLTILDGKTGKLKRQVQLAGGHDCLLFADLTGSGRAQQMAVKDRYSNFWVYDAAQDFKLLWSKAKVITGHYPINFDFNGDGKDELLVGYRLYAPDGTVLWSHDEFPSNREGHNDAVDVKDMDGDGRAEIALATSADAVLLDAGGKILFRKPMHHTQHAMIGRFRPDLPGKQAFYISREEAAPGSRPTVLEALYTKSGELLWDNSKQKEADKDGVLTQAVVVENWTGNPNENFIALNRRGNGPPVLLDGWGREVAVFPFPPRAAQPTGGRGPQDRYTGYYVKHIDCYGDEREEILVYDENRLCIYTNAAFRERVELYNDTIYNGRK
ncbi:MAG: hypothetical protein ABSG79_00365 [Bryobacteraceae bacterium]|jgi:hypothetical protein